MPRWEFEEKSTFRITKVSNLPFNGLFRLRKKWWRKFDSEIAFCISSKDECINIVHDPLVAVCLDL